MLTVAVLILVAAFIITILSSLGKAPLWIPVLLIIILLLLQSVPLGR
jgi:hypothetical protein